MTTLERATLLLVSICALLCAIINVQQSYRIAALQGITALHQQTIHALVSEWPTSEEK